MTREERINGLAAIKCEVEELVMKYNETMQEGKFNDAAKIEATTQERIKEYTSEARSIVFDDCKATGNPMIEAVTRLTFMTIATKDEKDDEGGVPVRKVVDKERYIDLEKLDKHCGGIGANEQWLHIVQKMNFLLTAQKAVDLGIKPENLKRLNDSYSMSAIAAQYDMGKNPCSKTNLLKTLQTIVTAMLGEGYKATSHDVNYLMSIYSKKGRKALTVSCANHSNFRNYIAEVCHRIVTGASYDVLYKAKKEG